MVVVGFDTSTPATAAAVLLDDGRAVERRHDPEPGERPGHAARLLELLEAALAAAGADWEQVERIAVGAGPGGFTGLRIGIATARALGQARGIPLVAVGTLHALAEAAPAHHGPLLAVLDARRGEAFAAAFAPDGAVLHEPAALRPEALGALAAGLGGAPAAVGDGAVRFRAELEAAGARVPADAAPEHRVSAAAICRLGAAGRTADRDSLLPDYRREPDATAPRDRPG
ncbi:MAG TPA: tRNA (adenosine(37)-N6)-threonylcarbamoyltransferase complex dimerization subunit type 1 TsaB [Solirubrobacteraceae bacterium]|nr:tRNA (adenosine(37)-N6)-threonylcarbamoyltransferase complex dimerization subunit type 1 TsaB [Solirubrobacteraceae bacterium]